MKLAGLVNHRLAEVATEFLINFILIGIKKWRTQEAGPWQPSCLLDTVAATK
ncbi:MAG: hypothetical protein GY820_24900 [Gammaproteobacteria bacterium]|nr:hypothetical protein [Gammaproteobacteria bacterium]